MHARIHALHAQTQTQSRESRDMGHHGRGHKNGHALHGRDFHSDARVLVRAHPAVHSYSHQCTHLRVAIKAGHRDGDTKPPLMYSLEPLAQADQSHNAWSRAIDREACMPLLGSWNLLLIKSKQTNTSHRQCSDGATDGGRALTCSD
jgi:hypothetical protein